MKRLLLPVIALPLLAAAPPQRWLSLAVPTNNSPLLPVAPDSPAVVARGTPSYEPAPTPNRDVRAPAGPRASNAPSLAPSLFTTKDQYRGDGFSPGSTAQSEQEKRIKPGAGFSLHMPFTPQ